MGWKQWAAVVLVIGFGIVLQIPGHGDADMDHDAMSEGLATDGGSAAAPGPHEAVVWLEVTGMT